MLLRIAVLLFLCIHPLVYAQELFIFSEPASTMPKKALMFRMNSRHFSQNSTYYYKLNPVMGYGFTKNFTAHVQGYYSNWQSKLSRLDGVGMSAKYKIMNRDEHHAHKRLAISSELIYSTNPLAMEWMLTEGNTSLASVGAIYTQLIHKLALSAKLQYLKPLGDLMNEEKTRAMNGDVLEWQLSSGFLVLPLRYKNYKQINLNVYAEYIGQQNINLEYQQNVPASNRQNHDLGLGMQLIFSSRFTLESAYRFNLAGNMNRITNSIYYLNLEYMLFR